MSHTEADAWDYIYALDPEDRPAAFHIVLKVAGKRDDFVPVPVAESRRFDFSAPAAEAQVRAAASTLIALTRKVF